MVVRELRRSDGREYLAVMQRGFPDESVMMGVRPEEFEKIFERAFRWDTRLILGFLGLIGRPLVRPLLVEADGHVVATTMVTFSAHSAYVSNVVVDAPYRRRGLARQLLEEARRSARKAHRTYISLDVLETNTPARTLYESLGYRVLRTQTRLGRDLSTGTRPAPSPTPGIRPFEKGDASGLVEIVHRHANPTVEEVTPTGKGRFIQSGMVTRILNSENAAWVVDRGNGPEAHVGATVSAAYEAAFMSNAVLAESVEPDVARSLIATAVAWCAARNAPRVHTFVDDTDARGRAALEANGFTNVRALRTLYRTVD